MLVSVVCAVVGLLGSVYVYNLIATSAFLFLVIYIRKQRAGGDVSCDVGY